MPHLIKNSLHINCLKDGFVMYNDKLLIRKRDLIPPVTDSMIQVNFRKNN